MASQRKIKDTGYCSLLIGKLPKGCRLCVKGKKLVLFVTGVCSSNCFYCPISEQKKNNDDVYANEWPTDDIKNIIKEAKLCNAEGAGITGGDPLARIERTINYIKALKKEFGKSFHVHLYTPLNLVNTDNVKKLKEAGLDELRFHPDLSNDKLWHKMQVVNDVSGLDYGVEIPVIPGMKKQIIKLINYIANEFDDKIKFLNLNELEISDTNACHLVERGYTTKDELSYGVKGSEKLAFELLDFCLNTKLNVHYCTTTLKDAVQLAKRIKQRAKNVKLPFEKVDRDGLLHRYAIYHNKLKPGFSYNKNLNALDDDNKRLYLNELKKLKSLIIKFIKGSVAGIKLHDDVNIDEIIYVDEDKIRLLTSYNVLRKVKHFVKYKGFVCAKVIEYPTYDSFIVELEFW